MRPSWPLVVGFCVSACGSPDGSGQTVPVPGDASVDGSASDANALPEGSAVGSDAAPLDGVAPFESGVSVVDAADDRSATDATFPDGNVLQEGAAPEGGGLDSGSLADSGGMLDANSANDASSGPDATVAPDASRPPDASTAADASRAPDASTPSSCSAAPVTPNATQQAKNVLCYLYSQYGNHIVSGQEEDSGGTAYDVEFDYIYQTTGKYPAIRSFDANNANNADRCLTQWQANGLCVLGYHMGAPDQPDGYTGAMYNHGSESADSAFIDSVLTANSSNNTVFNQRLDNVVSQVQQVQNGDGVVILRLFHEAGGTWFWWSMGGGPQYVRLWQYAFNYITKTKGITGVLWLLPYDGSPQASFYPGKEYVDIAGADNYDAAYDYSPMTSIFDATRTIAGSTIPIALHENGPIPDPDQLQSSMTNWSWFNTWTAPYPEDDTSVAELQKVYSSSYVITRDEMPSLK